MRITHREVQKHRERLLKWIISTNLSDFLSVLNLQTGKNSYYGLGHGYCNSRVKIIEKQ